ncbi:hypothetical protein KR084_001993 [Drosophila pseudotakahashii]|nr:hypothetical protein KR084_001993 [Drosophila pseudotakahashii]
MSTTVLPILLICLCSALATANLLAPQHYCDNHFRYSSSNGSYVGIFTAPRQESSISNLILNWQATFEIQGKREMFVGPLQSYPNKEDAALNIMNGEPPQVFVKFVAITTELPKLISLNLNGVELCSSAPCK